MVESLRVLIIKTYNPYFQRSSGCYLTYMRVISKENGFFWDTIQVLAERYEECESRSFLGGVRWWMCRGETVIITVPKSEMVKVGDILSFPYCVIRDWKIIGGHKIKRRWS